MVSADIFVNRNKLVIYDYNFHNQIDTLNTYLVWLRLVYFSGKLTEEEYFDETEQFRTFLEIESEKEEKAFLTQFTEKWPL